MSLKDVFAKIDTAAHSFVKYAAGAVSWFMKEEPTIADAFTLAVGYAQPLIVDLIALEFGPGAAALEQRAVKAIAMELTSVKSLVYDWGVTGGVVAKVQALQSDVSSLDAAGYIKSDKGKSIVARILQELGTAIAGAQATPPAA